MTMATAMELDSDLELRLTRREVPEPRGDELLLRVEWAGLCGSDLHVMRTGIWVEEWPAVLGHEVVGRVEAAGPDATLALGTRVVADSRIPCGACPACAGEPTRCPNLRFLGEARPGGFASHLLLPSILAHPLPDGLDASLAVLAEPLAVAMHALGQLTAPPARALLIGHGPIGALVHAELRRRFPEVVVHVAEPAPLRALLARALGAEVTADARELAGSYDLVVDAAGYRASFEHALGACASGATLLLLALSEHPVTVRPIELAERRLRVIGCNAFVDELPGALALLAAEGWRYLPVITRAVSLAELPDAARAQLAEPDAVKVVIRP